MATMQRRSDLRTESWGSEGGLAVYDPRNDTGYLLNPATAAVFDACDGRRSLEEMATAVAARTGLPADVGIVELALAELRTSDLLETPARRGVDDVPVGVTRRTLMRRLALGAGAAALLPVVDIVGGVSRLAAEPRNRLAGAIPELFAEDKTASTAPGTPVDVTLSTTGGVTTPDSTAFLIDAEPTNGTVSLVGAVATYTPDEGFTGEDTFTYIAWQCVSFADGLACPDGTGPFPDGGSDPATVTITVAEATTSTSSSTTSTEGQGTAADTATRPSFTG
jgi:hypothetical protein